jgi:hypothetical protein
VGEVEQVFPVEMLPFLGFASPDESQFHNLRSIVTFARCFLGFSSIVRRVLPDTPLSDDIDVHAVPKLPIKFFWHDQLQSARDIEIFFRSQNEIDLSDGPWPATAPQSGFDVDFCKHLWRADASFGGVPRKPAFAVMHIACHYVTQRSPAAAFLLLSSQKATAKIDLSTIEREFLRLRAGGTSGGKKPLVFLNACSAAVIDPSKPSSLVKNLLREKYLGFIGTETDVPDVLASEFAQTFYRHWLGGVPLGRAIFNARQELLWQRNPLGLLYTFYANPNLRVTFA